MYICTHLHTHAIGWYKAEFRQKSEGFLPMSKNKKEAESFTENSISLKKIDGFLNGTYLINLELFQLFSVLMK